MTESPANKQKPNAAAARVTGTRSYIEETCVPAYGNPVLKRKWRSLVVIGSVAHDLDPRDVTEKPSGEKASLLAQLKEVHRGVQCSF